MEATYAAVVIDAARRHLAMVNRANRPGKWRRITPAPRRQGVRQHKATIREIRYEA